MAGQIVAKGINWSANKLKHVPEDRPGVFIIFEEKSKSAIVMEHENIMIGLRNEWWKKNFWYFSWFVTSPPEYRLELAEELKNKSYDELWKFS